MTGEAEAQLTELGKNAGNDDDRQRVCSRLGPEEAGF
jgi:hypothetical protein